jgi:hypothetical protein
MEARAQDVLVRSFTDGNTLWQFMNSGSREDRADAKAYVRGVADAIQALHGAEFTPKLVCAPDGITETQIHDIVRKHLAEHPEKRHIDAAGLTLYALIQAFPCKR